MDHNSDITNAMIQDRIIDLFATAQSSHRTVAVSIWRKLAGAALVHLGEAILGEPRPATSRASLGVASLSR